MASLRNIWLESPLLRRCYAPVEYCFATLRRQSRGSNPFLTAKKVKIQSTINIFERFQKYHPFTSYLRVQYVIVSTEEILNPNSFSQLLRVLPLEQGQIDTVISKWLQTSNLPLVLNKRQYVITSRLNWSGLQIPCALLKTRRTLKLSNSETPVDISGLSFELLPDTFYFELSSLSANTLHE